MTLQEIADNLPWGSTGFVRAVETWCGFDISRAEIERIAARSTTPEEFESVWENDDSWTDKNNG